MVRKLRAPRRQWKAEEGRLAPEVDLVRYQGLKAFEHPDSAVSISELSRIIGRLFHITLEADGFEAALKKLLNEAIKDDLIVDAEAKAVPYLFGLSRQGGGTYGIELSKRQSRAADAYRQATASHVPSDLVFCQKPYYERQIVANVGKAIEKIDQRGIPETADQNHSPEYHASANVRRPKLEAQVDDAFRQTRLVWLAGESGVGKTTFASEYVHNKVAEDAIMLLNGQSYRDLVHSIRQELDRLGVESDNLVDSALVRYTERLLADRRNAPHYVVLDDVADWELVERILSPELASKVLVTAQQDLLPQGQSASVTVGSLELSEAIELIEKKLPDVSEAEMEGLKLLRGRAIAIEHVCAFIRTQSRDDRRKFIQALEKDAIGTLGFVTSKLSAPSFKNIYKRIVDGIREREEAHVIRLLECAVVFSVDRNLSSTSIRKTLDDLPDALEGRRTISQNDPIAEWNKVEVGASQFIHTEDMFRRCLWEVLGKGDYDEYSASLAIDSAVSILRGRYKLIDELPESGQGDWFSMHPLTLKVLYEVFRPIMAERIKSVISVVLRQEDLDRFQVLTRNEKGEAVEWSHQKHYWGHQLEILGHMGQSLSNDPAFQEAIEVANNTPFGGFIMALQRIPRLPRLSDLED